MNRKVAVAKGLALPVKRQIGQRILTDILKTKRATYGGEILQTLSAKLTEEFGRWFSQRNLASMVRFAEWSDPQAVCNGPGTET